MKTKDELDALKEEIETLNKKLAELTEEELQQVVGGFVIPTNDHKYAPGFYDGEVENNFEP